MKKESYSLDVAEIEQTVNNLTSLKWNFCDILDSIDNIRVVKNYGLQTLLKAYVKIDKENTITEKDETITFYLLIFTPTHDWQSKEVIEVINEKTDKAAKDRTTAFINMAISEYSNCDYYF